MLTIRYQTAFKKDYKRMKKRGYDMHLLENVILMLSMRQKLPEQYRDHNLIGNYLGCRECHISSDWLLVYEINEKELILYLTRSGSHTTLYL
ncbi:MAG: type II toxin-antitoxin system YafQ family toxin [Oscillospiraceae bacterium]|nr:type II toxin-antitoxin system YafQ family toxin [Oscillospiraceae bacterium]